MNKDQKMGHLALSIIRTMNLQQRPKLNVQQLAKDTGVSRAWIYKYFGSDTESMVLNAIDCFSPELTELSKQEAEVATPKEWARSFLKGLEVTLNEVEAYPEVYQFMLTSLIIPNEFTSRIRHHEELYQSHKVIPKLRKVFGLSMDEARSFAEMIMGLRLGLVIRWMGEKDKSPANRRKVLTQIRKRVFDQFKEF